MKCVLTLCQNRKCCVPNVAYQAGASLIEVLIAVTVVGLVMTAITITMTYSMHREAENRNQESAVMLAQTAIDLVMVERSKLGWSNFYNFFLGVKCLNDDMKSLVNSPLCPEIKLGGSGLATKVNVSRIDLTDPPSGNYFDDRVLVTVEVDWNSGSKDRTYSLSQIVYKSLY